MEHSMTIANELKGDVAMKLYFPHFMLVFVSANSWLPLVDLHSSDGGKMRKAHRFPTGSRFDGSMNEMLHCMEGFGVYLYPDGSEYRGYFRNGKFHGFGRVQLASPYKATFKGVFDNGELAEIETMTFGDGLLFQGAFDDDGEFNLNDWRYCKAADRRYSTEITMGLEPVGPNSFLTRTRPSRNVPPRMYDIEDGLYRPGNGFTMERQPPFKPHRFVGCDKEVEFIRKHCRVGTSKDEAPKEPTSEFCRQIINTNEMAMKKLGENLPTCACNEEMERKRYWPHLCKPVGDLHTDNTSDMPRTPSSSSYSSFSDVPMVEDVEHNCKMEMDMLKIPEHNKEEDSDDSAMFDRRKTPVGFGRFSKFFVPTTW